MAKIDNILVLTFSADLFDLDMLKSYDSKKRYQIAKEHKFNGLANMFDLDTFQSILNSDFVDTENYYFFEDINEISAK